MSPTSQPRHLSELPAVSENRPVAIIGKELVSLDASRHSAPSPA